MPTAIIGMHRSGTSMLARLLNIAGMNLGDDEDINPDTDANPTGHWEHLAFLKTNERVQACFGGESPWPRLFPPDWREDAQIRELLNEQMDFVAKKFDGAEPWGWKDPRTTINLPFWREAVPNLRYVICVRNPLDVAGSLKARDLMPPLKSIALWRFYTECALLNTKSEERIIVHYEDLFRDCGAALAPVLAFLDLPPLEPGTERDRQIAGFINAGLKHHGHSLEEVREYPNMPAAVADLYEALLRSPENIEALISKTPSRTRMEITQDSIDREASLYELGRLTAEVERLHSTLAERTAELTESINAFQAERSTAAWRIAKRADRIISKVPGLRSLLRAGFHRTTGN